MIEPWGEIERLLVSVGGRDEDIAAEIGRIGLARVATIAVGEILARCVPVVGRPPVGVQLVVAHGDRREGCLLSFESDAVRVRRGDQGQHVVWIEFDAIELLRRLFGTTHGRHDMGRLVRIDWPAETTEAFSLIAPASAAVDAVLAACSSTPAELGRLAVRFGSDKWGAVHWYTPHYEQHFHRMRDDPVRLLEIGIGGYADPTKGGGSLRMWQHYFRRGLIHGLDIVPKKVRGQRIRTVCGDQNDPAFLAELGERLGPFDIVIDDGSHVNEHVATSFGVLFEYVRPGGCYVIEDLQTSYWPGYGGVADSSPGTTVGLLRKLVDSLHDENDQRHGVAGVHVYRNLAIIDRTAGSEGPTPAWVPRAAVPGG